MSLAILYVLLSIQGAIEFTWGWFAFAWVIGGVIKVIAKFSEDNK